MSTKAETLLRLAPRLRGASVLPLKRVRAPAWAKDPERFLSLVLSLPWGRAPLIARSSARGEDAAGASQAGRFLSVAGVRGREALRAAFDRVFASYGRAKPDDEAFVQPMLMRTRLAGVAFSREPSSGAPYVVVNYTDAPGDTSSVTSGRSVGARTLYHLRGRKRPGGPLGRVIALTLEVEALLGGPADIEFAVTAAGRLVLLQARPLAAAKAGVPDDAVATALGRAARRIERLGRRHPYLHGRRTILGVMPDWNPAEIIGVKPRPLALSLYKELITDSIWAYQRDNYGYKNLRSFPLMVDLLGIPYVDVRVDFNSFVPASLDAGLSEKLVDYYLDRLAGAPTLHDKVEFDVLFTCYTPDLPERLKALRAHGFAAGELKRLADALRAVTNGIIHGDRGLWRGDLAKVRQLDARHAAIVGSGLDDLARAYWLLEDVKRYGTLPFAGLARAGFIATSLLRSLKAVGVLSAEDVEAFMGSLDTVASRMERDSRSLGRREFLERYGHLRPGTYDILSPRYDEAPERYFDFSRRARSARPAPRRFAPTRTQLRRTEALLREHRLEYGAERLFWFMRQAIEGRELAKFLFTRHLSDILRHIGALGRAAGLSAEDCSFASVSVLPRAYASSEDVGALLRASAEEGRRRYALTQAVHLPPLVTSPATVWSFHLPATEPNFVTLKKASGPVIGPDAGRRRVRGSVVAIPNADPGFDWLFAHAPAGLVTMYGGVNSHMAVRAAEMGIPAVIGAGEANFAVWSRAGALEIDAAARQVLVLR